MLIKKILRYIVSIVLMLILCAYFIQATRLTRVGFENITCDHIKVTISDSLQNRFVTSDDIKSIILSHNNFIGTRADQIDLYALESLINQKSAVKNSKVALDRNGVMYVSVNQRKPVIRLQSGARGVYVDSDGVIFPLTPRYTSYVPVITGEIPIDLTSGDNQLTMEEERWLHSCVKMGLFLERNDFWGDQIEQINIENNGDVTLSTRVGNINIIFGGLSDFESKFKKLYLFYQHIIPVNGWERYQSVNLKYDGQLVCIRKKE